MQQDKIKIRSQIIHILQQAGVTRCSFFGSFAKGTEKEESDIDIMVELPKDKTLLDLIDLKLILEEKLGKKVDVITYASVSPFLKPIISKEEIPLYGQGS